MAGLATALGSGAMTNSINEIRDAACVLSIGSNTTHTHPIIGLQVKQAIRNGAKLIVANPKKIELAKKADIFIQHRPGTDVALLMGMLGVIIDEGLTDEAFIKERCEGFDELKKSLEAFDLKQAEEITGVPGERIAEAARLYAQNSPASILYCMGITQHSHGTDNVLALSNLALVTGNLGKRSAGVNPLRGQNNVQGACDMGALPNVFTAYQKVADEGVRKKIESAWGVTLSSTPGMTHGAIFDAILEDKLKALYIIGENPVLSEANSSHAVKALEKAGFLVVQDIFLTETARLADVVLPAASFAEKDGTFTNTERRVQRIRKAIGPVGDARPDWEILCGIAQKMGSAGFDFSHPKEVMEEIASLTPSYGGVTYERIDREGIQWPCPTPDHPGTPILHTEKFPTAGGRAKLVPLSYRASEELPDDEYPLLLTTDRSLFHYHTGTMTRKVAGLEALDGQERLKINPRDASSLGIADGDMVEVASRRGKVTARSALTDICPPGVVSMTFHFSETPTNVLTSASLDPVAKTPETKVCAVKVAAVK
ncbi:Formate dehydrogenase subunit alpha (selenocysteine-containing) [Candidatus Desulfarcum epimagneticum]|uniref:Formate dehydrogenase subunit alpha (Selenocysteine-containing) n=1 Tax=uncultured Desulfobacteraceae bacterium TaxID=218296 RepID=A0A484HC32_9BACT|nr:Formate dehydrogenase subunit alpha (selenocysteine-containing) [uncultured Desulfobacteraceae bacterium]